MADATRIEVVGSAELQSTLKRAAEKVQDLSGPNREVSDLWASTAKPPRRTGALAGSIRGASTSTEAAVEATVPYAGVIEYGWPGHNIEAASYLRDAFATIEPQAMAIYEKAVDDVLADVKGA